MVDRVGKRGGLYNIYILVIYPYPFTPMTVNSKLKNISIITLQLNIAIKTVETV